MDKKHKLILVVMVLFGVGTGALWMSACKPVPTVYFDDTGFGTLKLGNRFYEIGFKKTNGGIQYIVDKSTGKQVTQGNLNGCLWAFTPAFSAPFDGAEACKYNGTGKNRFRYTWSAAKNQLILDYLSVETHSKGITTKVTISPSEGQWFDLQMQVFNNGESRTGDMKFPASLVFGRSDIREALLPILPGIILEPGFFSRGQTYQTLYPGFPGVFSDYMDILSSNGQFAMYAIAGKDQVVTTSQGFDFSSCTPAGTVCAIHTFKTTLQPKSQWLSPQVRIWISAARKEVLANFRRDVGIDGYDSLKLKTGKIYNQLVQSPLYKADTGQLSLPFSSYPELLKKIPYPGLLHPVGYEPGGFDDNYPDLLPPDPRWGSTEDMAKMFAAAHALGFLVMPYTNPTWWDEKSPTLTRLPKPLKLANVTVLDAMGQYISECYGCPQNPHYGVVVSPYVPFVQDRIGQLILQMTHDLGSDLVFEDQIGARAPLVDFNPASPYPESYAQGWLDHTRQYSTTLLMTELGFDCLTETETGLNGSLLLQERYGAVDTWLGRGNWRYYPFATQVARDKVLFYQHDLAPETFVHSKSILAWDMSMGYMLSYDLVHSSFGGGLNNPFLPVVGAFQKYVLARYASERITDYQMIQELVTKTSFENYTLVTNWAEGLPYESGAYTLASSGLLLQKNDGSFTAGIFTRYNNAALSDGDHYLIEERRPNAITVRQPMGHNTDITLMPLPGWKKTGTYGAWAYALDGRLIAKTPVSVSDKDLTFRYVQDLSGQPVAYFEIVQVHK